MLEAGTRAAPFTLRSIDGATYKLEEGLIHGPVLLVFFEAACGACHTAFPYYNRLWQTYPQEGWHLWAISQDEAEMARFFASRHQLSFPVLLDEAGWPVSKIYDPPSTPSFYLVETDGTIAAANAGFSKDDLNELARLLAERLRLSPQIIAPPDDGNPPFRPGCVPRHLSG